nr:MAG TPA: hypothetical protein [Caudoviricetes sp.]
MFLNLLTISIIRIMRINATQKSYFANLFLKFFEEYYYDAV